MTLPKCKYCGSDQGYFTKIKVLLSDLLEGKCCKDD